MLTSEKNVVECDVCGKMHKMSNTNKVRMTYLLDETGLRMRIVELDVCRECFGQHFRKLADKAVMQQSMRIEELAKAKLVEKGDDNDTGREDS